MIINHNMASLNTYRQLSTNNTNSAKSLEKLSSGLRINRAGDDAAGLAISEKMRGQIRGLDQASRNAQDSISLLQTAEGALNETHSILQRMRELSVQAANDTATATDRSEMQKEIDQLTDEIDRIGNTTEFNTKKLLNGGVGVKMTSNGTELSGVSTTSDTKSGVYAVAVTAVATQAVLESSADAAATVGTNGSITINGTAITLASGDDMGDVVQKINNYSSSTGVTAMIEEGSVAGTTQKIKLVSTEYGSDAKVAVEFSAAAVSTALGFGGTISLSDAGTDVAGTVDGSATGVTGNGATLTVNNAGANADGLSVEHNVTETAASMTLLIGNGTDAALAGTFSINGYQLSADLSTTLADATYTTDDAKATQLASLINASSDILGVTATASGDYVTLTSNAKGVQAEITAAGTGAATASGAAVISAADLTTEGDDGVAVADANNITVAKDNVLTTHIGSNEDQTMDIDINDMRATALSVNSLDVTTQSGAEDAITTINDAIEKVSSERSKLGAFQNRLEHTIANLGTSSENLTAAESRIRDVDMAKEMMNFQKNNILSQAAQAMLAQANQQPQGVLQLLR